MEETTDCPLLVAALYEPVVRTRTTEFAVVVFLVETLLFALRDLSPLLTSRLLEFPVVAAPIMPSPT
jgi:hypothetical protein